ncbi:MAG: hypothetical protein II458_07500, partial [Oscillospiraceae bacterium]|nr:hypothetical protein [Oscillospiraceae bacterium]
TFDRRFCAARRLARPRRKGLYAPPGANDLRAPAKTPFLWETKRWFCRKRTSISSKKKPSASAEGFFFHNL